MKKLSSVIWGLILVAVGAILALNALGVTKINIFFKGWWTLFIIVPCAAGLLTGRNITGNLIGVIVGVLLLLSANNIISFSLIWKLVIPGIIIFIGLKMIWNSIYSGRKLDPIAQDMGQRSAGQKNGTATFSGLNLEYDGEVFDGAELNAVFGGIKCDLRKAIFEKDCIIHASAIFGGIEIYVPANINIKVISDSIFGGVSNKKPGTHIEGAVTLYVKATCVFGGVEIK